MIRFDFLLRQDDAVHDHEKFARITDWIQDGRNKGDKDHLSYFNVGDLVEDVPLDEYFRYK